MLNLYFNGGQLASILSYYCNSSCVISPESVNYITPSTMKHQVFSSAGFCSNWNISFTRYRMICVLYDINLKIFIMRCNNLPLSCCTFRRDI